MFIVVGHLCREFKLHRIMYLTQDNVADHVNSDEHLDEHFPEHFVVLVPRIYYAFRYEEVGYITMQYVDGNDCNQNDLDAISLAVN
jgi:hypothetical protein